MKKIISLFLISILMVGIVKINHIEVSAYEVDFSTSDTVKQSSLKNYQELACGVDLYQYNTSAYNDGIVNDSKLGNFTVSWFDYGTNDVRVVNWTGGSYNEWGGATATALAHDYETKHPGYLVIGAVNGDFFRINDNCEVKNVSMQEGDLYKAYPWDSKGCGVIGWTYDGTIIDGMPTISSNMYLEIYDDDNNKQKEVEIASVNNGISNTGISLLSADVDTEYDFTGCKVAVIQYTVHRYLLDGNTNHDRLFISGLISDVTTSKTKEKVEDFHAYLVSKDGSLDDLEISTNIKCQYHLTGDWSNVVNTTGYYAKILEDGVSLFKNSTSTDYSNLVSDKAYINCLKNRTIIGKKADGSTILMTIEYDKSTNSYGASYYECAEYLRLVGCVEGWLLDGGGSTTLATRNDNGDHLAIGGCSDGSERRDGNAILLVVKDPGITAIVDESNRFDATISIADTGSIFRDNVTINSISIGDQSYDYQGVPIKFTNLEENTKYTAKISYTLTTDSGVTVSAIYRSFYTANFDYPTASISVKGTSDDACLIEKDCTYRNNVEKVYNYQIVYDDKKISFDGDQCLITGLKSKSEYTMHLEYDCIEKDTSKIYHGSSSSIKVKTTVNPRPIVIDLSVNKAVGDVITFNFEYYDPNEIVTRAYLDCYGMEVDLSSKKGTANFEGIDLSGGSFEFSLEIDYNQTDHISSDKIKVDSTYLEEDKKQEENNNNNETKKKGCKKSTSIVTSLLLIFSSLSTVILLNRKKH